MTVSFVKTTPDDKWMSSPHADYAPLAKQVRHLVWVSGMFNDALKNKKINPASKKASYADGLERASILAALEQQDSILSGLLEKFSATEADAYQMDFFGNTFGLYEFLNNMVQHETMHHGMWTLYARLGGFAVPDKWKSDWEL